MEAWKHRSCHPLLLYRTGNQSASLVLHQRYHHGTSLNSLDFIIPYLKAKKSFAQRHSMRFEFLSKELTLVEEFTNSMFQVYKAGSIDQYYLKSNRSERCFPC